MNIGKFIEIIFYLIIVAGIFGGYLLLTSGALFLGVLYLGVGIALAILMVWANIEDKKNKVKQEIILSDIEEIVAVCNYKKSLTKAAKPLMTTTDYYKFKEMLDDLDNLLTEAHIATLLSADSLLEEKRALSPKLDPAIMGGLADGIAGPAAGVYTALNVAEANAEIDEARREASANARKATSNAKGARSRMIYKYQEVLSYVKKYNQLKAVHAEALSIKQQEKQAKQDADAALKKKGYIFAAIVCIIMILIMR